MNKIKKLILALTGAGIVMAAGNTAIPSDISTESVATAYNASKQVKGKYRLENAKMVREAKANPKDRLEIEIGDDGENFKPKVKVERWDDEVNFSLELLDGEKGNAKLETENDKIKWSKGNKTARFYEIDPSEQYPEGAFEFDIELAKKPKTNIIEFSLNTKGVDFFYQPRMDAGAVAEEKSIADGAFIDWSNNKWIAKYYDPNERKDGYTETHAPDGFRPDNVVGSYPVYASEQKANWKGGKEYKTGKLGHIYRPKIYDANGAECWGSLSVEKEAGKLTVEIPQEFLDKAVYPVVVDPTFGYTTAGSSSWDDYYEEKFGGSLFTGAEGTISKVSIFLESYGNWTTNSKIVVALHSDLSIVAVSSAITIPDYGGHDWIDRTLTPTISAVDYLLGKISSPDDYGPVAFYYDTGATNQGHISATNSYSSPTTLSSITHSTKKFSIYATYEAGGGETSRRIIITQ